MDNKEEGGGYVQSSWPLCPGGHTGDNGADRGAQDRKVEPIPKLHPSSDRGMQFAHVELGALGIAEQQAAVNTFPGLVHTARNTTKVKCNRSTWNTPGRKLCLVIGVKS